jgi:hypothetical protein
MTRINPPELPTPTSAVGGDWHFLDSPYFGDAYRRLTWARFDAAGIVVAVEGAQYRDGNVDRFIVLDRIELECGDARRVGAALLDAADSLEALR